jgi:hypothetical protein
MVRYASVAALAISLTGCARPPAPTEVDATIVNNLVLLPVRINNSAPLSFILDTAASTSVVNSAVARQIGLSFGNSDRATTGGGTVETNAISGASVSVGTLQLGSLPLVAIDLSRLQEGLGNRVDGILGYDLFQRFIVEIDYIDRRVRFHQPTQSIDGGGDEVPLTLDDQIPFVNVTLVSADGSRASAQVEFDTGQTGALTITRPFVEANHLVSSSQQSVAISTGAIIAGGVTAHVTRVASLQLGSAVVQRPVVNVTPGEKDAGVSAEIAGVLGAEVLRRFDVIVDYTRHRVLLRPNREFGVPMEFDMSGMSLAAVPLEAPSYRVRSIVDGSPAVAAGIEVGDIVTHINGVAASQVPLSELRQKLRVPDSAFVFTTTRGGVSRSVSVRTRRLI